MEDREKIRKFLESIPKAEALTFTAKTYRAKTRHVGCTDALFNAEKFRLKRKGKHTAVGVTRSKKVPLEIPFPPGKTIQILASIDLSEYTEENIDLLKKFAVAMLTQCFDAPIDAVMLSHPPTLELRRR